jgi:hypothetical protein
MIASHSNRASRLGKEYKSHLRQEQLCALSTSIIRAGHSVALCAITGEDLIVVAPLQRIQQ